MLNLAALYAQVSAPEDLKDERSLVIVLMHLHRSPVPGRGFADSGGVIALDGLAQARFITLQ